MWTMANRTIRRPVTAMTVLAPIDERTYATNQLIFVLVAGLRRVDRAGGPT